jgi:aryl-alcohol dehydrogenase-like predicted oxidoreductase
MGAASPSGAAQAAQGSAVAPILRRAIPKSGELLPIVGVGTWLTFDVGTNQEDRAQLTKVLARLFAAGGSMIDSSPMYRRAEAVVGDLLASMRARDKAFLATKVWTEGEAAGRAQMEQSFTRFRTDKIDLMQVHNLVDWQTQLKTMRAWRESGRFRYLGITHYTPAAFDDVERVLKAEPLDFLQIPYSIAVRDAETRILGLARDLGVAVIANRPFDGGDLFPKTRGRPLPGWAQDFDCQSWAQFFLKYLLGHPAMTCVIPGTRRPDYMVDNLGAGRGRLPDAATRRRMAALIDGL